MQFFFDFFPIIIFFIAFKFWGIYVATSAAIVTCLALVLYQWLKNRHVPTMQWVNLAIIVILGGSTLIFHNELFIKWKPTALSWGMALVFLGSQFLTKKSIIQRMLEEKITLNRTHWSMLNIGWSAFFGLIGIVNLFVAYHFDTNTWVNFKLFGILGLTFVFAILQAIYLAKHIKETEKS